MTPDNPAPDAQDAPKPQSRPAAPPPAHPGAPGTPESAPIRRGDPLLLTRIGILIGAIAFTFFGLGYLSVVGDTLGRYIVGRAGWENIKIKSTPSPAPAPRLAPVYTNPKDVPPPAVTIPNIPQQAPPAVPPVSAQPPTPKPQMTIHPVPPGVGRGGGKSSGE